MEEGDDDDEDGDSRQQKLVLCFQAMDMVHTSLRACCYGGKRYSDFNEHALLKRSSWKSSLGFLQALKLVLKQPMELDKVLVQNTYEDIHMHENEFLEEFILVESFWKRNRVLTPFKTCKTFMVCFDMFHSLSSILMAFVHVSKGGNIIFSELKHLREVASLLVLLAVEDLLQLGSLFLEELILNERVVSPLLRFAEMHGNGFCAGKPCHKVDDGFRLKSSWLQDASVVLHVLDMKEGSPRVDDTPESQPVVAVHMGLKIEGFICKNLEVEKDCNVQQRRRELPAVFSMKINNHCLVVVMEKDSQSTVFSMFDYKQFLDVEKEEVSPFFNVIFSKSVNTHSCPEMENKMAKALLSDLVMEDDNGMKSWCFFSTSPAYKNGLGTACMNKKVELHGHYPVGHACTLKGPSVHAARTIFANQDTLHMSQGNAVLHPYMPMIFEFSVERRFCLLPIMVFLIPDIDLLMDCPPDINTTRFSRQGKDTSLFCFAADFRGKENQPHASNYGSFLDFGRLYCPLVRLQMAIYFWSQSPSLDIVMFGPLLNAVLPKLETCLYEGLWLQFALAGCALFIATVQVFLKGSIPTTHNPSLYLGFLQRSMHGSVHCQAFVSKSDC